MPVEHVFVLGDEDGRDLDWVARTADEWIAVEPHPGFFTLRFEPRRGLNRGRVVVRDRTAGTSQVVRVTARLTEVRPGPVEGGRTATPAEEGPAEAEVAAPVAAAPVAAAPIAAAPPSVATPAEVGPAGVEAAGVEPAGVEAAERVPVPAVPSPAVPVEAPTVPVETRPVESGPAGGDPRPRRRGAIVAGVAAAVALVAIVAGLALRGGGEGAEDRAGPGATSAVTGLPTTEPEGAVTRVTVGGAEQWKPVVYVTAGQSVAVESSGTILHDVAHGRSAGPDGDTSPDIQQYNVVAAFPHGGLIGRIGEQGQPFAVGARKTFSSPAGGMLYLQVNDVGLDSNGGEFQVVIRLG
ncbi:MAG: hypothetical protein LC792_22910 [Actinobacteria bacterium]|nr:hypothetical protein [Actinomycetota bacterium]